MKFAFAVLLALALIGALPSAAQADPLTCTGYPQSRIFIENHSWYITTPGHAGPNYGHVHAGTCFPYHKTISGTIHFDLRALLYHNPGILKEVRVDVRSGSGGSQQSFGKQLLTLTCDPTTICSWFFGIDVDTTKLPYDGTTSFLFQAHVTEPDGNIAFASGEWQATVQNGHPLSNYVRNFTEGAGWYTNDNYAYSKMLSLVPTSPVSGVWTFNISTSPSAAVPITHTFVSIDPNFHVDPPVLGTVLYDASGPYNGVVSIDTRTLTNGSHYLVIRGDQADSADSTNSGLVKIPFTVQN